MYDFEKNLEAKQARRMKAEDRFLARLEKREAEAETLIGELCCEGKTVYYINMRSREGRLTGAIKKFPGTVTGWVDAVSYLVRNNYV